MTASPGEVDSFIENVDEVARLIDGLAAGTLPPEYIARRFEERLPRGAAPAPRPCAVPRPGPHDAANGKQGHPTCCRDGGDAAGARDVHGEADDEAEAARKADLMRKVRRSWSCAGLVPPFA
jgi:hypothetical protein